TRAPFCFIQSSAALVSRPPEKAMPTFSPLGRLFRIVLIELPIGRNGGCRLRLEGANNKFRAAGHAINGTGRDEAELTGRAGASAATAGSPAGPSAPVPLRPARPKTA